MSAVPVPQASDATLVALAGADFAANTIPIGTGTDTLSQVAFAANTFPARASTGNLAAKTITDFGLSLVDDANAAAGLTTLGVTAFAQTILDDADASTVRSTLGLGTAATVATGTSGATIPLLNGVNVWSANQSITKASANYTVISSSGDATEYVSAVAGNAATTRWSHYTGSAILDRWLFGKDTTAEGGSNAGSDLACYAYDDAGSFLHTVFTVQRSTGVFRFGKEIRVTGDTGGQASYNTITGTSDVTANSSGVGTILFKGTTSRNSSGFIKIYIGTTAYYVPVFSAISG